MRCFKYFVSFRAFLSNYQLSPIVQCQSGVLCRVHTAILEECRETDALNDYGMCSTLAKTIQMFESASAGLLENRVGVGTPI